MKQFRNLPYYVTEEGSVYRIGKNTPLKFDSSSFGYRRVTLCAEGKTERFLIHRMVAELYVNNPKPNVYTQVNHIDHDPTNNHKDNLEWCDHSQNMLHCHRANRCSNLLASAAASDQKFEESTQKFKKLLGDNFIKLVNENPRNFVIYKCSECGRELKSRTDSPVFKQDVISCRYCK